MASRANEDFQATFKCAPAFTEESKESPPEFRFSCAHPASPVWGEWKPSKTEAKLSAVERALGAWSACVVSTRANEDFQTTFKCSPTLTEESRGSPPEFRFSCAHPASPIWGEWKPGKKEARVSAVERALEAWSTSGSVSAAQGAPAAAPARADGRGGASAEAPAAAREGATVAASASPSHFAEAVPPLGADFSVVYERAAQSHRQTTGEVLDLLTAFEQAPGARGVLEVQEIRRLKVGSERVESRNSQWREHIKDLQGRAWDETFPKPNLWNREDLGPVQQREREDVWWHLISMSRRHVGENDESCRDVWTARIFHGCPSEAVAASIMSYGFAGNVQNTKGWFGEGIYTSTSAPYALRYSFKMRDFWDCPGQIGVVVAGRAAFCQVYPVTQADNDAPLVPGLKGKRIAAAKEAKGCDAHFVCVRRHPPNEDHDNWTYHACADRERPDGTELVVNQESQYLPEYVVKVKVRDDPEALRLCGQVREAAQSWGRPPEPAAGTATEQLAAAVPTPSTETASSSSAIAGGSVAAGALVPSGHYKQPLHALVTQRLKRDLPSGFITYIEEREEGEFIFTVRVPIGMDSESGFTYREFRGNPQPRRAAAQHDAAKVAWEALKGSS